MARQTDHVQGAPLSSVESGTNFGTKFSRSIRCIPALAAFARSAAASPAVSDLLDHCSVRGRPDARAIAGASGWQCSIDPECLRTVLSI